MDFHRHVKHVYSYLSICIFKEDGTKYPFEEAYCPSFLIKYLMFVVLKYIADYFVVGILSSDIYGLDFLAAWY